MRGIFLRGRSVPSSSTLKFKILKIQKIFACGAFIFNIHIFRFKMDSRLQVDIDFNTEF